MWKLLHRVDRRNDASPATTSIDAMVVGVGQAFMDADIVATAAAIGLAVLIMVTLGVMVDRVLGTVVDKRTEMVGGVILIAIGCLILYEHIGYTTSVS